MRSSTQSLLISPIIFIILTTALFTPIKAIYTPPGLDDVITPNETIVSLSTPMVTTPITTNTDTNTTISRWIHIGPGGDETYHRCDGHDFIISDSLQPYTAQRISLELSTPPFTPTERQLAPGEWPFIGSLQYTDLDKVTVFCHPKSLTGTSLDSDAQLPFSVLGVSDFVDIIRGPTIQGSGTGDLGDFHQQKTMTLTYHDHGFGAIGFTCFICNTTTPITTTFTLEVSRTPLTSPPLEWIPKSTFLHPGIHPYTHTIAPPASIYPEKLRPDPWDRFTKVSGIYHLALTNINVNLMNLNKVAIGIFASSTEFNITGVNLWVHPDHQSDWPGYQAITLQQQVLFSTQIDPTTKRKVLWIILPKNIPPTFPAIQFQFSYQVLNPRAWPSHLFYLITAALPLNVIRTIGLTSPALFATYSATGANGRNGTELGEGHSGSDPTWLQLPRFSITSATAPGLHLWEWPSPYITPLHTVARSLPVRGSGAQTLTNPYPNYHPPMVDFTGEQDSGGFFSDSQFPTNILARPYFISHGQINPQLFWAPPLSSASPDNIKANAFSFTFRKDFKPYFIETISFVPSHLSNLMYLDSCRFNETTFSPNKFQLKASPPTLKKGSRFGFQLEFEDSVDKQTQLYDVRSITETHEISASSYYQIGLVCTYHLSPFVRGIDSYKLNFDLWETQANSFSLATSIPNRVAFANFIKSNLEPISMLILLDSTRTQRYTTKPLLPQMGHGYRNQQTDLVTLVGIKYTLDFVIPGPFVAGFLYIDLPDSLLISTTNITPVPPTCIPTDGNNCTYQYSHPDAVSFATHGEITDINSRAEFVQSPSLPVTILGSSSPNTTTPSDSSTDDLQRGPVPSKPNTTRLRISLEKIRFLADRVEMNMVETPILDELSSKTTMTFVEDLVKEQAEGIDVFNFKISLDLFKVVNFEPPSSNQSTSLPEQVDQFIHATTFSPLSTDLTPISYYVEQKSLPPTPFGFSGVIHNAPIEKYTTGYVTHTPSLPCHHPPAFGIKPETFSQYPVVNTGGSSQSHPFTFTMSPPTLNAANSGTYPIKTAVGARDGTNTTALDIDDIEPDNNTNESPNPNTAPTAQNPLDTLFAPLQSNILPSATSGLQTKSYSDLAWATSSTFTSDTFVVQPHSTIKVTISGPDGGFRFAPQSDPKWEQYSPQHLPIPKATNGPITPAPMWIYDTSHLPILYIKYVNPVPELLLRTDFTLPLIWVQTQTTTSQLITPTIISLEFALRENDTHPATSTMQFDFAALSACFSFSRPTIDVTDPEFPTSIPDTTFILQQYLKMSCPTNSYCSPDGACVCSLGFTGPNCEYPDHPCLTPCNEENTYNCDENGSCICKPDWVGPSCSSPASCSAQSTQACSGHGYLIDSSSQLKQAAKVDVEHFISAADSPICPSTCECTDFWTGPDCSTCGLTCSNAGLPLPNCQECGCQLGFSGVQCQCQYASLVVNLPGRSQILSDWSRFANEATRSQFTDDYTIYATSYEFTKMYNKLIAYLFNGMSLRYHDQANPNQAIFSEFSDEADLSPPQVQFADLLRQKAWKPREHPLSISFQPHPLEDANNNGDENQNYDNNFNLNARAKVGSSHPGSRFKSKMGQTSIEDWTLSDFETLSTFPTSTSTASISSTSSVIPPNNRYPIQMIVDMAYNCGEYGHWYQFPSNTKGITPSAATTTPDVIHKIASTDDVTSATTINTPDLVISPIALYQKWFEISPTIMDTAVYKAYFDPLPRNPEIFDPQQPVIEFKIPKATLPTIGGDFPTDEANAFGYFFGTIITTILILASLF